MQERHFAVQSGDTASSSGRSLHDVRTGVCNRRSVQLAIAAAAAASVAPCPPATALTLQDVTPQVVPAGALSARYFLVSSTPSLCCKICNCSAGYVHRHVCYCREEAIIDIFERNTNSVANVFDITLQVVSQAEQPIAFAKPVLLQRRAVASCMC